MGLITHLKITMKVTLWGLLPTYQQGNFQKYCGAYYPLRESVGLFTHLQITSVYFVGLITHLQITLNINFVGLITHLQKGYSILCGAYYPHTNDYEFNFVRFITHLPTNNMWGLLPTYKICGAYYPPINNYCSILCGAYYPLTDTKFKQM